MIKSLKLAALMSAMAFVVACSDSPEQTSDTGSGSRVLKDNSYLKACTPIRYKEDDYERCLKDAEFRKLKATEQAQARVALIAEAYEKFGTDVLQTSLDNIVREKAIKVDITDLPTHFIGMPASQLELPMYFEINGSLFGFRNKIGLSAILSNELSEFSLQVDRLTPEQRDFLETICQPENNLDLSQCRGTIFAGLVETSGTAHLSLIGADLTPFEKDEATKLQMARLW